jgi:hypothetical protein
MPGRITMPFAISPGRLVNHVCIVIWFILILFFYSCQVVHEVQPVDAITEYDGSYTVSFMCSGFHMANATINVINGTIEGQIIQNVKQQTFKVAGTVSDKGKLKLYTITTQSEEPVEAVGAIDKKGMIQGSYRVGNRNCKFIGFCYSKNQNDIVTQYDGTYQLDLISGGNNVASFKATIENGQFHRIITNINHNTYTIDGKVSKNGRLILNTLFSDMNNGVTVIGCIQKDGSIMGIYSTYNGKKGAFSGKRIDSY